MTCLKQYCVSLKTGSLIIAHFFLMTYTVMIVASIYANSRKIPPLENYIFIIIICVALLMLIVTVLLLYGIYRKIPNLMLPWLIIKFLGVVIGSIVTVILCGSTIVAIFMNHNYGLFIIFFAVPLILCIYWCVYYVVYSHYKQLTETKETKPSRAISRDDMKISIMQ